MALTLSNDSVYLASTLWPHYYQYTCWFNCMQRATLVMTSTRVSVPSHVGIDLKIYKHWIWIDWKMDSLTDWQGLFGHKKCFVHTTVINTPDESILHNSSNLIYNKTRPHDSYGFTKPSWFHMLSNTLWLTEWYDQVEWPPTHEWREWMTIIPTFSGRTRPEIGRLFRWGLASWSVLVPLWPFV